MLWIKKKKNRLTPVYSSFLFLFFMFQIKVGFKGVYIPPKCYHNDFDGFIQYTFRKLAHAIYRDFLSFKK